MSANQKLGSIGSSLDEFNTEDRPPSDGTSQQQQQQPKKQKQRPSNADAITLGGKKDLWTLIREHKARDQNAENARLDTVLFFVGSKGSGKSTIVHRFMDKDEAPTPTVGLEYNYGRRTRGVTAIKDVVHIWELAGGTRMSQLINVPLNEQNLHNTSFVLVLDLSKPESIVPTTEALMSTINARFEALCRSLESRGSKRPKNLRAAAAKKYAESPDRDTLPPNSPCAVPLVFIGSKYDVFKGFEPETRKRVCKTVRYLAHVHGAYVVFTAHKDENLVAKCRQLLILHAFRQGSVKGMSVDHGKPLLVCPGNDTFASIGIAPTESVAARAARGGDVVDASAGVGGVAMGSVRTWMEWRDEFSRNFPWKEETLERPDLSKFPEPAIDALCEQKYRELERMRKNNQRKAQLGLDQLKNGGMNAPSGKAYSRAKAAGMDVPDTLV
ncbi:hypothetical protein BJ742DRAFT_860483 [Cladochytrium replicatum]|nr:hypothetical protein BJ742DRAFT_860483 [Cladochytrium replicatum]